MSKPIAPDTNTLRPARGQAFPIASTVSAALVKRCERWSVAPIAIATPPRRKDWTL